MVRPRPDAIPGVKAKDDRKLWFGPVLSEGEILRFDERLGDAITEFASFIQEADGLKKYFPENTTDGRRIRRVARPGLAPRLAIRPLQQLVA